MNEIAFFLYRQFLFFSLLFILSLESAKFNWTKRTHDDKKRLRNTSVSFLREKGTQQCFCSWKKGCKRAQEKVFVVLLRRSETPFSLSRACS